MLKLAWRNLWRNRTRTAITGSAIALSLLLQLFSYGTADSTYEKMEMAAVKAAGGNVLVHADGYWGSRSVDKVIRDAAPLRQRIAAVTGVEAVIPRVILTGLVSSARGNAGVELVGLVPAAEKRLDDKERFVKQGTFLVSDKKAPIVLGKGIVDDLRLELGDKVVMTASDPDGEITRMAFRLVGIAETGSDMMDDAAAWTTLAALQTQLKLPGAVTQLGIVITDDAQRAAVRDDIAAALGKDAAALELLTWSEAMPEMLSFVEIDKSFSYIMGIFIFIVVAFGIANTFLMAVLERVRELGLLSALGLTPARIARLVVIESVLLAIVAIGLGLAAAYGIHVWVADVGIDFSQFSNAELDMGGVVMEDMIIYSVIDPVRWFGTCAAVFLLIVMSASYPAWRATRMEPATAMRTYE